MVTVWFWRMSNYPFDVLHLLEVSKNACWEISLLITCSDQQEPPGSSRSLLELLHVKSYLEGGGKAERDGKGSFQARRTVPG